MPNPSDYDKESEFMSACVSQRQEEHPDEDSDQSVAVCMNMWKEKAVKSQLVIYKTHASSGENGMEFVLSDATPDRFGDVIDADGWDLVNFRRNPIALFNHDSNFPVGRWENLKVIDGELRGQLRMAPPGTSPRIDEIRRLVDAGILKAVSVGFRPIASKPRSKSAPGELFLRSELVETSIVAIPANPNALAIAKGLKISRETQDLVFAKHGNGGEVLERSGQNGEHAKPKTVIRKNGTMSNPSPIAQRITDGEQHLVKLRDQLTEQMKNFDDENPSDDVTAVIEDLTSKIETRQKSLDALRKAEQQIAASTVVEKNVQTFENGSSSSVEVRNGRPFAVAGKKTRPSDYLFRTAAITAKYFVNRGGAKSMNDLLVEAYGEDVPTKTALDLVTRAASAPAITTVAGWADTFVQTMVADLIDSLMPVSVFPRLAAMGQTYTFGQNGIISLPSRTTGNLGGGFVLQGAPIPVKQGAFTAVTMTPKKMAVITTLTREMAEHSTPSLEGILRQAIMEDTGLAIDTVLLDNNAASATRPQGLQNVGGAALGPTAAGGIAAIIGDLKLMVADLQSTTSGNIRKPVWIINPGDVLAMSLTQAAAGGDLPFRDELARGTLLGYPVIQSATGTTDTFYLMDASDFATSVGVPRFDVSDQAVLHMEDTTPLAIGTAGTPATVAAPTRSLYQTDSMALRLIWPMDWAVRRANTVAWVTNMSWN
jgi:HK97 family phage major capsid protein/HK97 family phage prohead protease